MEYFSIIKWPLNPNLLTNFEYLEIILEDLGLFSCQEVGSIGKFFDKKRRKKGFWKKKKSAPISRLKLDLGFGS